MSAQKKVIPVCEPALLGREIEYVTDAVSSGWISSSGKYITAFEEAFASYCGVNYAVSVCNGTAALHLALTVLGIKRGDEVLVPDFTMIASAFAVCYSGAMPVFIDAEPVTWNIDVALLDDKIRTEIKKGNNRLKAIMPVHIYGHPCDMDGIMEIAGEYGLSVIEDAAEVHGAEYKGKKVGSFGDINAFSFYANKNLTTGEGGMVVTNNKELYDRARYFKNLCFPVNSPRTYIHKDIGFNYRMSNVHAAIGLAQVEKADEYRAARISNACFYQTLLADVPGLSFQPQRQGALNVYWMNGVVIDPMVFGASRDALVQFLKDEGIDTRNFFQGMHRQPSLSMYGCDCSGGYPVSDLLADNGFYLPSSSLLKEEDIRFICDAISHFGCKR
jgi:perosamine synthetase